MNYIGSKYRLSAFLKSTIVENVGADLKKMVFCDLFAGTGIVGRVFKNEVRTIISNDIEFYSYVLNRNYIGNNEIVVPDSLIDELNALNGIEGFIYKNYCLGSGSGRQYFSDYNGKKIDAIRKRIERLKMQKDIDEDSYFFLLSTLIEAADKVANTASVYGAFLKSLKKTAQKEIFLDPICPVNTKNDHQVYCEDGNELIKRIKGDILYLDPPYNSRQYGANYHLLNTIAKYDTFVPAGKTGLRSYQRSAFCKKQEVSKAFENLIKEADFTYIFLSYNNEGLMTTREIKEIMSKYGTYDLVTKEYSRFRADKRENRNHKADSTTEHLHILKK